MLLINLRRQRRPEPPPISSPTQKAKVCTRKDCFRKNCTGKNSIVEDYPRRYRPATTWQEALESGQVYTRFKHFIIPARKGNSGASPDRLSSSSSSSAYDSSIPSPTSDPGSPVPDDYPVVGHVHRRKSYSPSMENKSTSPPKSARKPHDEEKSPRRGRRQETRSKSPSKKLRSTSKNLFNYNADREAKEKYLASRSPLDQ